MTSAITDLPFGNLVDEDRSKPDRSKRIRDHGVEMLTGTGVVTRAAQTALAGMTEFGQNRSIKRESHARGVERDRLDLDSHDLSLLRFLEHRAERVRLGPAVYWRVDSVRNASPRVEGSFGHVRIDAQVWPKANA